jgi:hypothetical protein
MSSIFGVQASIEEQIPEVEQSIPMVEIIEEGEE